MLDSYWEDKKSFMKKKFCVVFLMFLVSKIFGQQEHAWIYFKDKPSSTTYLSNPLTMLTQRALDRRTNQSIVLDIKDVPLEASYVSSIANSSGITVKARSKWLNALHVQGTKTNIDLLVNLSMVDSIDYADKTLNKSKVSKKIKKNDKFGSIELNNSLDYGSAENQIDMLHGDYLHDLGFTGTGIQIAVLDAGFKGVETFAAFSNLLDTNNSNGEILGGYDFVNRNTNFYLDTGSTHGLSVLSTMGGYLMNQYIGTAPNAQYYLFVTEDPPNESPLEESLWVEAAERADSLGVDIINTSLGYTTFDNSSYDYSYADMNGKTAFITRGAELAASKGILLVNSAGNSGNDSWHYIGAPADASSVLSVGAVASNEAIASFSSFGPTSDNRVKPEVLAQGQLVYVINSAGNVVTSNGTSFSSPIMAGMSACLWQAFPDKTAQEIKNLIVQSSDIYTNPTDQRGYGVPDFQSIYEVLSVKKHALEAVTIYPTIVENSFKIHFNKNGGPVSGSLINISGVTVLEIDNDSANNKVDISNLPSGIYFVELKNKYKKTVLKLIKK